MYEDLENLKSGKENLVRRSLKMGTLMLIRDYAMTGPRTTLRPRLERHGDWRRIRPYS
jgi:hypothetical protein